MNSSRSFAAVLCVYLRARVFYGELSELHHINLLNPYTSYTSC